MYRRILVATDGSTLSNKAVCSGIGLAAATGAELVALHVVPRYPMSYIEGVLTSKATKSPGPSALARAGPGHCGPRTRGRFV
jgi:nucleotide-binding universal stress UspA family protein